MKKSIKYISFYNKNFENRIGATAAVSKIDFVIKVLSENGYYTTLISPSWTTSQDFFYKASEKHFYENHEVLFPSSFSSSSKFKTFLSIIVSLIFIFIYCLKNLKKNEKIIVYHSPWLVLPIFLAKAVRGFKVILEVEEIYSDVKKMNPIIGKLEHYAFDNANYFIFSNDVLAEKLKTSKPYIVLYGNYEVYDKRVEPEDDGKIHLLYAGIIDFDKRGAFNALEAAKFLDDNYILHIIGSGLVNELKECIDLHNKKYDCKVLFDGQKNGLDYIEYAQKCHIGLSTQKMEGDYLDTSFPSKIINYLGLGLNVISGNIKCVKVSTINNLVNFYEIDSPIDIANAISSLKFINANNIRTELINLDKKFKIQLLDLIK